MDGMHYLDDNVGGVDAAIRWVLGVGLLALGFYTFANWPHWALFTGLMTSLLPGGYLVLTALARADPIYVLWEIDTVKEHRKARGASPKPTRF